MSGFEADFTGKFNQKYRSFTYLIVYYIIQYFYAFVTYYLTDNYAIYYVIGI